MWATHSCVRHGSNPPGLTSALGPWVGVLLEHHVSGGARDWNQVAPREHVLILGLRRPVTRYVLEHECTRTVEFKPGQLIFHPAMIPFSVTSSAHSQTIMQQDAACCGVH